MLQQPWNKAKTFRNKSNNGDWKLGTSLMLLQTSLKTHQVDRVMAFFAYVFLTNQTTTNFDPEEEEQEEDDGNVDE
jgi:hypothetical protein